MLNFCEGFVQISLILISLNNFLKRIAEVDRIRFYFFYSGCMFFFNKITYILKLVLKVKITSLKKSSTKIEKVQTNSVRN